MLPGSLVVLEVMAGRHPRILSLFRLAETNVSLGTLCFMFALTSGCPLGFLPSPTLNFFFSRNPPMAAGLARSSINHG